MYLLKVNNNKNCYHLNINLNNVLSIYYPNLNEPLEKIDKVELENCDTNRIQHLIDEFEKTYINYAYIPPANDISISKTNLSNKKIPSKKTGPYHIPAKNNQEITQIQTKPNNSFKAVASLNVNKRSIELNNQNCFQYKKPLTENNSGGDLTNFNKDYLNFTSEFNNIENHLFAHQSTQKVNSQALNQGKI